MAIDATAAGQTGAHDVEASLGQRCLTENAAAMNWEAIDAWLASVMAPATHARLIFNEVAPWGARAAPVCGVSRDR